MNKLTKFVICLLSICIFVSLGWWGSDNYKNFLNPDTSLPSWSKPRPLEKYTIENQLKTDVKSVKISIEDNIFNFELPRLIFSLCFSFLVTSCLKDSCA